MTRFRIPACGANWKFNFLHCRYYSVTVCLIKFSTPCPELSEGLVASILVKRVNTPRSAASFQPPRKQTGGDFSSWRVGRTNLAAGRETPGKILRPPRHRGAWIIYYERRRWIARRRGEERKVARRGQNFMAAVCLIMAAAGSPGYS